VLFGYPIDATSNNWLHECICEAIKAVHSAIDDEGAYPGWPDVLPEEHREKLKTRRGVRDKLVGYDLAVRQLSKEQRDLILDALEGQNRVADLLAGDFDCVLLDGLPKAVRPLVSDLFGFAFELLSEFRIRDEQYQAIYSARDDHVCPFCGTEFFDAPGAAREDLDHYLARKHYAFAAANLRNLVPMGHKCNSRYKKASDLLRKADGERRIAFDPYVHNELSVSLDQSQPFGGSTENTPSWNIQFVPDSAAVSTWDEVFAVRERYRRDHLDPDYPRWLRLFAGWVRGMAVPTDTDASLLEALQRFEESWAQDGMRDRAFLKAGVFRMLRRHCEAGNERLKQQLRDLTAPADPVA